MDVFGLHSRLIDDYSAYTRSFIRVRDRRIADEVERELNEGILWPEPLLQLNPSFEVGESVPELVRQGVLHAECDRIFALKEANGATRPLLLRRHQSAAVRVAKQKRPYILTTGTGSGKSLCYIIPIVDHVLRNGSGKGLQAIIVYPMNALANSQMEELDKFLKMGYGEGKSPVSYARYTGQESASQREQILASPPDILLTNYVMLELILTRVDDRPLVDRAADLQFLVFDELHTYRGRQGADVAMLVRRCRESFSGDRLVCVGTSATMSSEGDSAEQARTVARVGSSIFGQTVLPNDVIGESLVRATHECDFSDPRIIAQLKQTIESSNPPPTDLDSFVNLPLASWIEHTFGLQREVTTGRLTRATPRGIGGPEGAGAVLARLTSTTADQAANAIRACLRVGATVRPIDNPFPIFAFRLHQFVTRGDTAYGTLEPEHERYLTLKAQQFKPGDRDKRLYPMVFCRECGQEYFRVSVMQDEDGDRVVARGPFDRQAEDDVDIGYLYVSSEAPWPESPEKVAERVPPDWVDSRGRVTSDRVPDVLRVRPDGVCGHGGIAAAFLKFPFRFCLNPKCGVAYNARQRTDTQKLGTIGIDGRSTATSVLAMSAITQLRQESSLERKARKLLSFTDNRQDASLQAGHFNDFAEVGLIRSGLCSALAAAGAGGLRYDTLVQRVDAALKLPVHLFANENTADLKGPALEETRRALRSVLGYYLYRDLARGWRVTSPNLEQCGLLRIDYLGLQDLADDIGVWRDEHAPDVLIAAAPAQRADVVRTLLDHLRRGLALREDSLTPAYQERIATQSTQRLRDPWLIEDQRTMETACVAWPRPSMTSEYRNDLFVSPQSAFGLYLRRSGVLPPTNGKDGKLKATQEIIDALFRCLTRYGLVEQVREPANGTACGGYQLPSSVLIWLSGDGTHAAVDHLRVTQESELGNRVNQYFVAFYKRFVDIGAGLYAREHTAQVPADIRQEREEEFRTAELPILFCSPTMELGVDIAQLNVVNMRNAPPTPANYAQRSGRAGRSGQPALVYTYCSGFSPHDQWYFRQPGRMVAGQVAPPRLDLANRDLIQAHVHAIWLAEASMKLGQTLTDVLDVRETEPRLPVKQLMQDKLNDPEIRRRAVERARRVLGRIGPELQKASWYREGWIEDVLGRIAQTFDQACDRWRDLYRAAVQQRTLQNQIIGDHTKRAEEQARAKSLRAQAESQIQLLTNSANLFEGDFYSYRYFASEGFLPGYNFPRLPLSAFIPARRGRRGKDEFLSRPRFLAIAEFGPRAVVYHEGSRYRIHKVNLAATEDGEGLTPETMKICSQCGYGHQVRDGAGPDVCDHCRQPLQATDILGDLVRLQNVSAKRDDRITSDEEERRRTGFELRTTCRFAKVDGRDDVYPADILLGDDRIATLRYGDAATIWRINFGLQRRQNPNQRGFRLDTVTGFWESNQEDERDAADPMGTDVRRVVPYVEDRRNLLILRLSSPQSAAVLASLQSALKQAIQRLYQLEATELAVEPLPTRNDRRAILLYEAAEGGAGVLRQVAEDPTALPRIARKALEICHFNPDSGEDGGSSAGCEAGCYDCLLEYGNQLDHDLIDRKILVPILTNFARCSVAVGAGGVSRTEQFNKLHERCDTELERRWLKAIEKARLRLPSHGQRVIADGDTRCDFYYEDVKAVIYVDGPVHDDPATRLADEAIVERLIDAGYVVIRFHHASDWSERFAQYKDVFGGEE